VIAPAVLLPRPAVIVITPAVLLPRPAVIVITPAVLLASATCIATTPVAIRLTDRTMQDLGHGYAGRTAAMPPERSPAAVHATRAHSASPRVTASGLPPAAAMAAGWRSAMTAGWRAAALAALGESGGGHCEGGCQRRNTG
jgi:hypothetical protein